MKDEPRVVDALVKLTVRHVLFPDLRSHEPQKTPSPRRVVVASPAPAGKKQHSEQHSLPFQVGRHHAHVLSYASWSDLQLQDERHRLQTFLRDTRRKRQQVCPELDDDEDDGGDDSEAMETAALEALALLQLFQRERESAPPTHVGEPSRLLHAQLALFAQYFEKCQARKILHEFDVVAIQRTYQSFLDNQ